MEKSSFRLFAILAVLVALAAGGRLYAAFTAGANQHLEKADCAQCHLAGKSVTAQQATMLIESQEKLCAKCHLASTQVSHPSGFPPRAPLPVTYPVDWKGDLTCSTCHEIHGSNHGLLRGDKVGKQLCFACHEQDFFRKMRDGGASIIAGHLAKGATNAALALDPYSSKCMECHNERAAAKIATVVDRNSIVRHSSQAMNHPIGSSYQKAVAFGGYRKQRLVERKVMLPNGNIGCVSCHSGYQKEHGKLAVTGERSALCFVCHDL